MYDTVTLSLPIGSDDEERIAAVCGALGRLKLATGEVSYPYSGWLENFKVTMWPGNLILSGSLAKYRFGNNIETLSRRDAEQTIEEVGERLGQTVELAHVYRLDLAHTSEMKEPVETYWRDFVTPSRMRRVTFSRPGPGLRFENGQRSIVFYDKAAETRKHGARARERPEAKWETSFLAGSNLLRFEVQWKRNLAAVFGHEIKAATLSDAAFYRRAVKNHWEAVYFGLERQAGARRPELPEGERVVKSFVNRLAAERLQEIGGLQGVDEWVKAEQRAGRLRDWQVSRLKRKARELLAVSLSSRDTGPRLADELDSKVRQAALFCR